MRLFSIVDFKFLTLTCELEWLQIYLQCVITLLVNTLIEHSAQEIPGVMVATGAEISLEEISKNVSFKVVLCL